LSTEFLRNHQELKNKMRKYEKMCFLFLFVLLVLADLFSVVKGTRLDRTYQENSSALSKDRVTEKLFEEDTAVAATLDLQRVHVGAQG
jgi:hypothetical protein